MTSTFTRPGFARGFALAAIAMLGACSTVGSGEPSETSGKPAMARPSLGLFSRIKAPSDLEAVLQLSARGVQVFRCEKRESGFVWVFRQPDAELFDPSGRAVGRHGSSFSFENIDGSRLVSTIAAYDDAPNPADLRWLLLTTRSYGKGAFDAVTYVQRINTRGGMPPESCQSTQANQLLRVDFSAEFVFYRARAAGAG
jgi:hypothetical protein